MAILSKEQGYQFEFPDNSGTYHKPSRVPSGCGNWIHVSSVKEGKNNALWWGLLHLYIHCHQKRCLNTGKALPTMPSLGLAIRKIFNYLADDPCPKLGLVTCQRPLPGAGGRQTITWPKLGFVIPNLKVWMGISTDSHITYRGSRRVCTLWGKQWRWKRERRE